MSYVVHLFKVLHERTISINTQGRLKPSIKNLIAVVNWADRLCGHLHLNNWTLSTLIRTQVMHEEREGRNQVIVWLS